MTDAGRRSQAVAGQSLEWFSTPLGSLTLSKTRGCITDALRAVPGQELLILGVPLPRECLEGCLLRTRYFGVEDQNTVAPYRDAVDARTAVFVSESGMLPFPGDSVNAIVIHHGLDITSRPHDMVREAGRVLAPGGHLVVAGFNPWSLWGLRRFASSRRGSFPWNGNFIAPHRLTDWLRVLGFTLDNVRYFLLRPPIPDVGFWDRTWCQKLRSRVDLPLGGAYVACARKQAVIMRPVRERRRVLRPAVIGMPMPKPTARQ
jgi:SAM-dependent methyltransferase